MLRVGLTGGIACGKSHVLRRLARRGLAVLDLDAVAHDLTAVGGAAYTDVVQAFGPGILGPDGSIDRRRLGAIVFADPQARARLDALVHPRVREEELRRADAQEAAGQSVLVSDAALLVEAGAHLRFERLVVVHCTPDEQLARLVRRDGLGETAARPRIEAQMPIDEKRRFAHLLVDSSGTPADTDAAADALAEELLALAERSQAAARVPAGAVTGALSCGAGPGPRGLSAMDLLQDALGGGGIELDRLARRLQPPSPGPWYRAARVGEASPWPESLAAALALWAAARGHDRDWLAGAAASVCRLTHAEGEAVSGAVLAALAALALAHGEALAALAGQLEEWTRVAMRWGGAVPPARVEGGASAAASFPRDCHQARGLAARLGCEPAFAGALVGLAGGAAGEAVEAGIAQLARQLSG